MKRKGFVNALTQRIPQPVGTKAKMLAKMSIKES